MTTPKLPERVARITVVQVKDDVWRVLLVGSYGTQRLGNLYNSEPAAKAAGRHLLGLVMR